MEYEYGVVMRNFEHEGLHRGPWTKEQVVDFITEWEDALTPSQKNLSNIFYVVKRPVGEWEPEQNRPNLELETPDEPED